MPKYTITIDNEPLSIRADCRLQALKKLHRALLSQQSHLRNEAEELPTSKLAEKQALYIELDHIQSCIRSLLTLPIDQIEESL